MFRSFPKAPSTFGPVWETRFEPRIRQAIAANPDKVRQLLNVTQAPVDPDDPATIAQTITGLLWYNVFATEDALQKLGGSPYDNKFRTYQGSDNDRLLNRKIKRYRADPGALIAVEQYETTGLLDVPVVTLHTTGDYLVPFEQQLLYDDKVEQAGSLGQYTALPVERYGHCTFEPVELLAGLTTLINQVTSQPLAHAEAALSDPGERAAYRQLMLEHGQASR